MIVICESPYKNQMQETIALAFADEENVSKLTTEMGNYVWITGDLATAVWAGVNSALVEPATTSIIAKVYEATGQKAKPRN